MTTGNKLVDEVSELRINSIPETWYSHIRKNNQPNAMAILLLWDIIYWYKCTEVRDENTGLLLRIKKKFKSDDFLQRNYQQIADKFGISKKVATTLTDDLVDIGVIKKHFRTISVNGLKCSNVMFIEVVPSVLKALSSFEGYNPAGIGGVPRQGDTLPPSGNSCYDEQGDTNTNIITSNYTNNYTTSSEPPNPFVDTEDCKLAETNTDSKPVQSKKVPSSPSAKQKKVTFSKEDYTECRNIISANRQYLRENNKKLEEALYDIRYVNTRLKKLFEAYGVELTKQGLRNSIYNQWLVSVGYTTNGLLSSSMFPKYIANEQSITNSSKNQRRFQQVFDDTKQRNYDSSQNGEFKL